VLIGILLAMTVAGPARADFIGVTFSPGNVYRFDESGGSTLVGPSGFRSLNSLAKDSSGNLYTQGFSDSVGAGFVRIDPITGIGTRVAPNPGLLDVRGLAFDASDNLYAIVDGGTASAPDKLYTIDLLTGTGQLIGSTGFSRLAGLELEPATGALYAWDTLGTAAGGLIKINPATGAGTNVGAAVGSLDIQALAIGADGTLFGARQNLYSINAATGQFTLVSNIGQDIRGLASIVPTPSSAMLALLLIAVAVARRTPRWNII
jgi:hypothetical protein